jgi:hypothetical protein
VVHQDLLLVLVVMKMLLLGVVEMVGVMTCL